MKSISTLLAHPYFFLLGLVLGIVPFLFLVFSFFSTVEELREIENAIEQLHFKQERLKGQGQSENAFLSKMKNADHFYIDNNLESLTFLESEISQLELQSSDSSLKKRLEFLKGSSNKFLFAEDAIRRGEFFQEVEERLQHPVEMNEEDLKKILCLIEEIPISPFSPPLNAPQLVIKNFDLSKKNISSEQEVFVINLQLIKREGK